MSLEFTLVRRAISLAVIDGPDTGDNPDILKAQGSVLFEPVIKKGDSIQVQTRGGSQTYALAPIECPINDGIISHRGQDGVKLPAGGEAANPSLIRWKATFSRMQAGGKSFTLAPVIFDAVPGGEIDLTMVAPVAGAPEGVVRGPRGTSLESIIVDGSELVFTAVDDAGSFEIARIPLDDMVRAEADAAADGVRDALAADVAASQSARDAAEGHANRAATSESNAKTSETSAKQSETNAGDYAAVATTAATEAVDAMESTSEAASTIPLYAEQVQTARDEVVPLAGQVATDASATAAHRAHVDDQVAAIDTAFTESVPPYLQPDALDARSPISALSKGGRTGEAIRSAIAEALTTFPLNNNKNRTVYIPAGDYEIEPGFFSSFDYSALGMDNLTQAGLRIVGDGKHATRLILKTGGEESWFYDSYTDSKNLFMDLTFEGISFLADDPNMGNGFKQWSTGQDKRFRFINCVIQLNTILHTLGTGNADLNRFINTSIRANGPAIILENQQSVANGMHNCDVTVRDSFIEIRDGGSFWFNNGNLEMHNEGTNTGDHFLIDAPDPAKNGPGNCEFNFTDVRFEIHGVNKKLARTVDSAGMLQFNFTRATLGTVTGGVRDSVDIGSGTRMLFRDCVLNESLNFIARSGRSDAPSGAVIVFNSCDVGRSSSLWTRCTTVGDQARIIANDCFRQSSGVSTSRKNPQDFDFGWRTAPSYAPQPQTKIVSLKNRSQILPWPGDDGSAFRAAIPEGSYVKKVHVRKPAASGVSGDYQFHVGSLDKSVIYGSSDTLGYGEEISLTLHDIGTVHESGIAVWATGTPSSRFSGGAEAVAYAEYI